MSVNPKHYINREISWLSFNARVLQEANDPNVPLMEKIKFFAIFSSNLDEFFRVRVATLKRLMQLGKKSRLLVDDNPERTLNRIQEIVTQQQSRFEEYYQKILQELQAQNITIVDGSHLTAKQEDFVKSYFKENIRPAIVPLMASQLPKFPVLTERSLHLAVHLVDLSREKKSEYALVEVSTNEFSRFIELPCKQGTTTVMLLEDLVRLQLPELFAILNLEIKEVFPIKITRDAELDIEDNVTKSFVETISKECETSHPGETGSPYL